MKIKIIADLPVAAEVKPKVGEVYDVVGSRNIPTRGTMYTVTVGRGQVGVFESECEIMPEGQKDAAAHTMGRAPALEEEPEL